MLRAGGCDAVYLLYLGTHKMVVSVVVLVVVVVVCCWAAERLGAKPKPGFLCRYTDSYPTSPTYLEEIDLLDGASEDVSFSRAGCGAFQQGQFFADCLDVVKYCVLDR